MRLEGPIDMHTQNVQMGRRISTRFISFLNVMYMTNLLSFVAKIKKTFMLQIWERQTDHSMRRDKVVSFEQVCLAVRICSALHGLCYLNLKKVIFESLKLRLICHKVIPRIYSFHFRQLNSHSHRHHHPKCYPFPFTHSQSQRHYSLLVSFSFTFSSARSKENLVDLRRRSKRYFCYFSEVKTVLQ